MAYKPSASAAGRGDLDLFLFSPSPALLCIGVHRVDTAIRISAASRRLALRIARKLTVTGISPDTPLKAVTILNNTRGARSRKRQSEQYSGDDFE